MFTSDLAVLALAKPYLRIAVWAYLFFALMHPTAGVIQGVGNTGLSLVSGLLDGVVARVGLSTVLGATFGMWGYFWGFCLAGGVSALINWIYYFSGRWEKRSLL